MNVFYIKMCSRLYMNMFYIKMCSISECVLYQNVFYIKMCSVSECMQNKYDWKTTTMQRNSNTQSLLMSWRGYREMKRTDFDEKNVELIFKCHEIRKIKGKNMTIFVNALLMEYSSSYNPRYFVSLIKSTEITCSHLDPLATIQLTRNWFRTYPGVELMYLFYVSLLLSMDQNEFYILDLLDSITLDVFPFPMSLLLHTVQHSFL